MNTKKQAFAQAVVGVACSVIGAGMYYSTPPAVSCDDNPYRSKGARAFKHKKKRRKTANSSKKVNRRKRG